MTTIISEAPAGCKARLDDALAYAARGWRVLPVSGKRPLTAHGVHDATACRSVIVEWFRRWPDANIGVAAGPESGLLFLDVDPRNQGGKHMVAFAKQFGPLPAGPRVFTGGGGHHFYFAHPPGDVKLRGKLGPGVDVLGSGRYAVAPLSVHPSGQIYRWEAHPDDVELPPLPPAWLDQVVKQPPPFTPQDTHPSSHRLTVTMDWLGSGGISETLPCRPGERHACLLRFLRLLKADPRFSKKSVDAIRPVVQEWHRQALPVIDTKSFAATWREAVAAWPRTTGQVVFDAIAAAAVKEEPPELVRELSYADHAPTVRLVALCRALQRHHGNRPFYLGCRKAAGVAGVDRETARQLLYMLQVDGVLELVTKGTRGRASEWKYLGED